LGAIYRDLRIADGSRASRRRRMVQSLAGDTGGASVFGCESAQAWRRGGGRRRTGDLRAWSSRSGARAGGEGDRHCGAASRATSIMRCRSRCGRWGVRGARALERFDDDHAAAATRTAPRGRNVFSLTSGLGAGPLGRGFRRGEGLANAVDIARPNCAGEEAIVADAVKAAGQHVEEKAADNDDVDMRMMGQRRAPGVEHGGEADARAQALRVGGDRGQRLGGGPEQEVVDGGLALGTRRRRSKLAG
jgi:hypothetical protein